MCFTGRISRLLNCLTGIDPLVHVHIVNLNDMFINVGKQLIKEDKYTTEAHQSQFEKELEEDYGYELTEEFRGILEEDYYSELEIFYDVFEPQVKSSNTNQGESLGK
jgi:cell division protein FtsI/penicillin-binding protein 2